LLTQVGFMNKKVLIGVLVVGLLLITGLLVALSYNGAVNKEQTVNENLSQIKNRYKTKLDILPALLVQVDGYKLYESGLLTNITELRTQWMTQYNAGEGMEALANTSVHLDQNLTQIVLTWENYPSLTADAIVSQYMGEVVDQNEQLSYSRGQYNAAVRDYNSFIKSFPNNVFASPFGFTEKSYWGTELPDGDALNI
jgi:LemA protein